MGGVILAEVLVVDLVAGLVVYRGGDDVGVGGVVVVGDVREG